MNDFKVGDKVFFIYADAEFEDISPTELRLLDGIIKEIRVGDNYVYFSLIECRTVDEEKCFKSKQECIDAFRKKLEEL